MKTSLIIFGVIFLVIGGFLFFASPFQTAKATTTTVGSTGSDTRTSYATVSVPRIISYATLTIGLILAVLGFALPGQRPVVKPVLQSASETHDTVETKEIEAKDGTTHKVVHERHVQHTHEK